MNWNKQMEEQLEQSGLVKCCAVFGNDRPYLIALIVPDLDSLHRLPELEGHPYLRKLPPERMIQHLDARRAFCDLIHQVNKQAAGSKTIERFALLVSNCDTDGRFGEETHLEPKRRQMIESLYREIPPGVG